MLAGVIVFFISVQLALLFGVPNFSYIAWPLIAVFGAATVISYSVIAEYYPKEILGQANSALNTFHILGAFGIQAMFGMVVALWQPTLGHYPAASYKTALGLNLVVQISALAWFISPRLVSYLVVKKRTSA